MTGGWLQGVIDATPPAMLVGFGGAVGAVGRYVVGQYVDRESFPVSVFVVNVVGTFLAGLVLFSGPSQPVVQFVAVGVCGSFTTFSSFSVQAVLLWENNQRTAAVIHAVGNLCGCLGGVGLAWILVALL